MSQEQQTSSAALPLIIVAGIGAFVLMVILLVLLASDGFPRWYTNGGMFMHLVLLVAMGQVGVSILLGVASRKKPLPIYLHLVVPVFAALVGLGGSHFGLTQAIEAIMSAPPDMIIQMWAACIDIADNTRQFGYVVAGCGGLSLVVIGLVTRPSGEEPEARADRFAGTLTACLGGLLGLLAIGMAFTYHWLAVAHEAMATAPPDMKLMMLTNSLASYRTASLVTLALVGVAALASAGLLARAAAGAGDWASRRGLEGGLALLLIGAVVGLDFWYGARIAAHQRWMPEIHWSRAGDGIELPATDTEFIHNSRGAMLVLSGEGVRIGAEGRPLPNTPATYARIKAEHERPPEREPSSDSVVGDTERRRLTLQKVLGRRREIPQVCGKAVLPDLTLAIDQATSMAAINKLVAGIRNVGACKVELLGRPRDDPYAFLDDPAAAPVIAPMRGILELERVAKQPALRLTIEQPHDDVPYDHHSDKPPLHLALTLEPGRVKVEGAGGELDRGQPITLKNLAALMIEIKDAFPDEEEVWVAANDGTSLSDFVEMLDIARETRSPNGEVRALFTEVFWIAPGLPPPARGLADVLGGIGGISGVGIGGRSVGRTVPRSRIVSRDATIVMGALSKDEVLEVIARANARVRYCYEKELARRPEASGRISVKFIIATTGKVMKVDIVSDTMGAAAVGECLKQTISSLRFPPPKGGGIVEVRYPFIFASN